MWQYRRLNVRPPKYGDGLIFLVQIKQPIPSPGMNVDTLQSHKEEKSSNAMGEGREGRGHAWHYMHTAGLGFARFLWYHWVIKRKPGTIKGMLNSFGKSEHVFSLHHCS